MNFANWPALSRGPIDIDQSWGRIKVATEMVREAGTRGEDVLASIPHFLPSSSCTASVAIMTDGSFVLILERRGTSVVVRVSVSKVLICEIVSFVQGAGRLTIEWKQMRVATLTESMVVLEKTAVIFGNRTCFTVE